MTLRYLKLIYFSSSWLFVLAVLSTTACSAPGQYVESTGQFAKATANLVDASNTYFDQVNYINFDTSLVSAEYSKAHQQRNSSGSLLLER
jgi:hypothetical protein